MSLFLLRYSTLIAGVILLVSGAAFAQEPAVEAYRVRVVTKDGHRFRGVLNDVTDDDLYIDYLHQSPHHRYEQIPLTAVRKVVIRRNNKKTAQLTGAILGGLVVGVVANNSLQKNPSRSPVTHGLTLVSAAAAGATAGLLLGSALGNVSSRVIRPLDPANPALSLQRQLQLFSITYQQNLINRLPEKSQ